MKLKITGVFLALILAGAALALAEDQAAEPQAPVAAAPLADNNANTQWVWGEVTGVDAIGKNITLKYLDYETDQEKQISLEVDDSTVYDNVKSLEGIQLKDNLSVDYISKDGKNLAKSISLERSENPPAGEAAATPTEATTAPADASGTGNNPGPVAQPSQANQ